MMTIATALQWMEVTQIEKDILCTDSCSGTKAIEIIHISQSTGYSKRDI